MHRILNLSRILHDLLFKDASQSLCSRAWQQRETSTFWRAWVFVFGHRHCRRSFHFFHGEGS